MNEQEQRIAITEACGWVPQPSDYGWQWWRRGSDTITPSTLSDYLHDLNAMHEAIMSQPQKIRMKINDTLMHLIDAGAPYCLDRAINATAAQRAEAFLRTIGKWTDA